MGKNRAWDGQWAYSSRLCLRDLKGHGQELLADGGGISSDLPFRSPSGDIRTDVMAGVVAHAFNT